MYGQDKQAGYAGAAAQGHEGKSQPELQDQIDRLTKALTYAEDSVAELANRMDGVLRPPAPEPAGTSGNQLASVGPSTRYGAAVYEFASRTHRLGERVQDLLRRLEA